MASRASPSPGQAAAFDTPGAAVMVDRDHPNYGDPAVVGDVSRAELA